MKLLDKMYKITLKYFINKIAFVFLTIKQVKKTFLNSLNRKQMKNMSLKSLDMKQVKKTLMKSLNMNQLQKTFFMSFSPIVAL